MRRLSPLALAFAAACCGCGSAPVPDETAPKAAPTGEGAAGTAPGSAPAPSEPAPGARETPPGPAGTVHDSGRPPAPRDERARIEALLQAVERADVIFIRNDEEHDGKAAAAHLRRKRKHAGGRELTAEQFVEKIASRSSTTGRDYVVQPRGGTTVKARDWLLARLREIDAGE